MNWKSGQKLQNGKLVIQDVLGEGGFGITYKALHIGFNAPVVIKTPNAARRNDREYHKYVDRFIREAQILAQLENDPHPHIVRVKDLFEEVFEQDKAHCLVMEFIEGKNLLDWVQERGRLSETKALDLICPVAEALVRVHQAGIVHRDVTPVNIMVRGNGQSVLIDFGLAGEIVPLSMSSKMFGNRAFAPYEQLIKGDRSPKVDIYTLAASLYYAVTGALPTDCFSRKVDQEPLIPPQDLASISSRLNDAILKGMDLNPTKRPESMAAWLELLRGEGSGGGLRQELRLDLGKNTFLELVQIPAGKFMMGSNDYDSEKPIHEVTVPAFLLGKYPVTNAQWESVMGTKPSEKYDVKFQGKNHPVVGVSWDNCQEFCKKLSAKTGKKIRLPSEAEWEYACRAGTKTKYYFGDQASELSNYAWYGNNSGIQILDTDRLWQESQSGYLQRLTDNKNSTHPVGEKKPNQFGFYDMHGNVWEWCNDIYHENYTGAPKNGSSWETGTADNKRVLRGGSWSDNAIFCHSAYRGRVSAGFRGNDLGFRLVVA